MHILVIGGTGRTGKLVIDEALARGHEITALVRDSSKLPTKPKLTVATGNPLSLTDVNSAFDTVPGSTPTAVIVTLNAQRTSDSPFAKPIAPPRFMADSHANLVKAMQARGIRKIVTMSAFGVGDSRETINWMLRLVMRQSNMAAQFEDHDLVDKEMRETDLDWVLVRPVMLAEGDATGITVLGEKGEGARMMSKINRQSVAQFLVDAAEKDEWVKKSPVISN